ncbi:hypothetical protein [Leekyejoonella antrihumi]|uniref:hypothetical protein n=1 Tax=Leekyejoonella antrihumi TaxID=1660198 RepID=UPI001645876E|nr:hypothetical protein [Leekyejoonella antrihumi]
MLVPVGTGTTRGVVAIVLVAGDEDDGVDERLEVGTCDEGATRCGAGAVGVPALDEPPEDDAQPASTRAAVTTAAQAPIDAREPDFT